MMINSQIAVSLIIIIFIYIILQFFIVYHLKNRFKVKSGPPIGQCISELEILDVNRNKVKLNNVLKKGKNLILFVDMDCDHCNKIIDSLKLMNSSVLSEIQFLLADTGENLKGVKEKNIDANFYFLNEEEIFVNLNIKGFPFYIEADNNNVIKKKGYASSNVIIEYLV